MENTVIAASPLDITVRARFEKWISSPPFELPIHRNGANSAWPGNYGHYETQLAWCAWEDATRAEHDRTDEAIESLTRADYRPSGIWRHYYPSTSGDWVCLRELRAALRSNAKVSGGGAFPPSA